MTRLTLRSGEMGCEGVGAGACRMDGLKAPRPLLPGSPGQSPWLWVTSPPLSSSGARPGHPPSPGPGSRPASPARAFIERYLLGASAAHRVLERSAGS